MFVEVYGISELQVEQGEVQANQKELREVEER